MNWKNRLTNYNFWISMFSAVLLILQALKIEFDILYVNEIFTAILGLLVVIGIICDPTRTSVKSTESSTNAVTKQEIKKEEKSVEKEEKTLPTTQENEAINVDIKNDIQTILSKISFDLDNKIKELKEFNLNSIKKIESEKTSNFEEAISKNESIEEATPAVAEIGNPFIDVIN